MIKTHPFIWSQSLGLGLLLVVGCGNGSVGDNGTQGDTNTLDRSTDSPQETVSETSDSGTSEETVSELSTTETSEETVSETSDTGTPYETMNETGGTNSSETDSHTVSTDGCTELSGTVTTIAKGDYCVMGDVIVPAGTTLQIPAGTTFTFMGRYHFGRDPAMPDTEDSESGTIWAIGTAQEPIVFQGATPSTQWWGIIVSNTNAKVHFEYVTIRDTYKNDTNPNSRIWRRGGGLNSYDNKGGTIIRHCTFINNRAGSIAGALAINGHGQWPNEGLVELTDNLFENNSCECSSYSGTTVDLCGGGAIRFSHVGGNASLVKIERNVFRGNQALRTNGIDAYGGAIGGFDCGIIIGPGNVFENNTATHDGALTCAGQSTVGLVIDEIDDGVVFTNNTPNTGCGK